MNKIILAVAVSLLGASSFAKSVDSILCVKSIKDFGARWQPYAIYQKTSENRPDVEVGLGQDKDIQFKATGITIEGGKLVLSAVKAPSTQLRLFLTLSNLQDPTGNTMASGILTIDGKAMGPLFECAVTFTN